MTEQEWLECVEPTPMLEFLRGKASLRKLRHLFADCCRRISEETTQSEATAARRAAAQLQEDHAYDPIALEGDHARLHLFMAAAEAMHLARGSNCKKAEILRDLFGPLPFRHMTVHLEALSFTVVSLGQAIYEERAFDRLPILADALEDAGCTNADILNHCRQPGEHVRGCWAVDLVLGKE